MQRLPIDISPKMDLYFRRFFTAWLIDHLDDGINISRSESDGKLCLSQVEDRYRNFIVEIIFSIKISFYTQSGILKKHFISFIFTTYIYYAYMFEFPLFLGLEMIYIRGILTTVFF